jgi:N-acetylmuramoyl-L-alanine amidase
MATGRIYLVQQGDCISSIANQEGLLPDTLWNANPELKAKRKNPNALFPGDEVKIPGKNLKTVSAATDQTHKFVLKRAPTKFRLIVERYQQPLANKKYTLQVLDNTYRGTTDKTGLLEVLLPAHADSGTLRIPEEELEYQLQFGYLDPLDEISGVQGRLQNLGYYDGDVTGEMSEDLQEALQFFQSDSGLDVTGELNDATRQKLLEHHDQTHNAPAITQPDTESGGPGGQTIPSDEGDVPSEEEDDRDFAALGAEDEEDEEDSAQS